MKWIFKDINENIEDEIVKNNKYDNNNKRIEGKNIELNNY